MLNLADLSALHRGAGEDRRPTSMRITTDPQHDWLPDLDHLRTLVTPRTRVVVIDPNNPTGAVYPAPVRRALIDFAERYDLTILADEVYGDLGYEGPIPFKVHRSRRTDHLVLESLKAYLAQAGGLVGSSSVEAARRCPGGDQRSSPTAVCAALDPCNMRWRRH